MKHAFRTLLAFAFVCAALASAARAQTPTPDPFVLQITTGPGNTFARDISADGRFVVIESTGDIATLKTAAVNNADGNLEIFLFDYAQRRIFQITNTKSQLINPAAELATRFARSNIRVQVANTRPQLSRDGRFIAFSSNGFDNIDPTSSPFDYDGNGVGAGAADIAARLRGDGNMELFLYRIPDVPAADLTSGELPAPVDLRQNAFTRVTNTPALILPSPGAAFVDPFVSDDNRSPQINDDGSRVVFISNRNLAPTGTRNNADTSPEVFGLINGALAQLTDITAAAFEANPLVFIDNPNISGDTSGASTVAFFSNATDLRAGSGAANLAAGNPDGNGEVFVAALNGTSLENVRQATITRRTSSQGLVNIFSPGRRLSRNGQFLAFESLATDPRADTTTNEQNRGLFVFNVGTNATTQVTARAANDENDTALRFPTFTGDLTRLVWASDLNLTATGTRLAQGDAAGLNPLRAKQVYSTALPPASGAVAVSRLTNTPEQSVNMLEPYVSNTQERISFSLAEVEFGGGNSDNANEAYYLLAPAGAVASDTPAASSALAYFTGATRREVTPPPASPTPTPSPLPPPPVTGLAPGMIGFVARTAQSPAFVATERAVCPTTEVGRGCDASDENLRRPALPVELGGVSVSIGGAAAGLQSVGPDEIQFVVPPGLPAQTGAATYPVVITIRGEGGTLRVIRSTLQVPAAQPDIFSSTNGPGGRARVTNVTNPMLIVGTPEPFTVTTTFVNGSGETVTAPTRLQLFLTGVTGVQRANVTVRLIKTDGTATDISGDQIPADRMPANPSPTNVPGVSTLEFILPASLAGAGDVRVVVLVNTGAFASRPADTAPAFRIN